LSTEAPDERDQKPEVETLLHDTQLLARVVDQVPTGIVITDATGRIVNANPEAERILGLERAEMVSRTY
jgi:PAS domain S-box-containing protein